LSLLTEHNRFSESFVDFLCSCLKIDPEQRVTGEVLLSHEFLSESHVNFGPNVSVSEILQMCNVQQYQGKDVAERVMNQQLDKFCEALKVVFMNKEVKEKFEEMVKRTPGRVVEEKKLAELASELDMTVTQIWEGMKREVLKSDVKSLENVEEVQSYSSIVGGRRNYSAQPKRIGM